MSRTDDRHEPPLPVTAEVGGEGGSFADATNQAATFREPQANQRTDGAGGLPSAANYAIHDESVAAGGVGTAPNPSGGMKRFPTEPPAQASGARARRSTSHWRSAALGVAAGFAAGLLARRH